MSLHSNFKPDLQKERKLSVLLDSYYKKHLKNYTFERIGDMKLQMMGVDLTLTHQKNGTIFLVDEKAQLDYINETLPTFAFELSYLKNDIRKKGWLFDTTKKTDFYALVTAIYCDEPEIYTTCKITWVNRKKLIGFLKTRNILPDTLKNERTQSGKTEIEELNPSTEGYLYFSNKRKAEKPLNLILKLDFLMKEGIAKRFV